MNEKQSPAKGRNFVSDALMAVLGLVAGIYILNPTAGVDLIPDFIPVVGNLDEAAAVTLLLGVLAHFGLDATRFFKGRRSSADTDASEAKESADNIIDVDAVGSQR